VVEAFIRPNRFRWPQQEEFVAVIGFSSSATVDGNVDRMVQAVLDCFPGSTEFYNLTQLSYGPCRACVQLCAGDNVCKLPDDLEPMYSKIRSAGAIVLGTPTYHADMNGFMRIFLERLWPFRHLRFPLEGKPYVVVAAGFSLEGPQHALESIKRRMNAFRAFCAGGVGFASNNFPCYSCGYGQTCDVGAFYSRYGEQGKKRLKAAGSLFKRWEDCPETASAVDELGRKLMTQL